MFCLWTHGGYTHQLLPSKYLEASNDGHSRHIFQRYDRQKTFRYHVKCKVVSCTNTLRGGDSDG